MALRPIACLITDRHRVPDQSIDGVLAQIRSAAAGGLQLVQIRERDLEGRALFDLTERAVAAVRNTATRIVVNDRLDVALAAGAHGVHLRSDSVAASRVRAVTEPGFLIGRSVHGVDEALGDGAHGADYLLFGTVFESASKPGRAPAGLEALAAVARATTLPVLAVGGITRSRVGTVLDAGAAGYAAISLFAGDSIRQ